MTMDASIIPSVESFHLVLDERAREMGPGVAIRLWKEMQDSEIAVDSGIYYRIVEI